MGYLCEERWLFQCIGYDYMAYKDYMDPMSSVPKKADKLNLSLSLLKCNFKKYWLLIFLLDEFY